MTNFNFSLMGYKRAHDFSDKLLQSIQKNYSCFEADPSFFWMKTFARFELVRDWKTRLSRNNQELVRSNSKESSVLIDQPVEQIGEIIRQNGYYQGLKLTSQTLNALLNFAESHPCYANRDPRLKFYIREREKFELLLSKPLRLAGYLDAHESCEAYQHLKQDPILRAIARSYFGCDPQYQRGEIAWSFPAASTEADKLAAAQVLHCDINDYKTLKFFFYLTEVTDENGPHVYLEGTHRNRKLIHQLMGQRCASINDQALIDTYGAHRLKTIYGSAGFGFAGDPYTFHQGTVPTQSPRLLLQLEFGVNRYKTWYFPSKPNA